ncbi:alkylglycerol monooxygenase [Actimicrobium sp. GrIS 1.19]|uniref:sterol desaturase family protein n=1 Tax=Actimicrobium sp. GrIS 1.19 TaxID=3071708 RepID=UPI002E046B7B|nr:alkylglycerol monooxygenase [Actimicrobium sp. GrIS 1.19]
MQEKVITLATPVFFLLIFAELLIGHLRGRTGYRANDAINSISLGVMSQVSGAFFKIFQVGIYAWMVAHIALFNLSPTSVWVWVLGLLLYDFCYYWLHRMGHEVNVLWAAHVVHHQSEAYNLSTALRQTSTGAFLSWIFYLPLALIGVPVEVFIVIALIDLLYQFWVHTEQIGRLGWFDRVFVSPSNHRAHHGVNDIYLDKNYGGILILWDRWFGTFVEEHVDEPVVYGTRSPLRSWNPLIANLDVYRSLWFDAWHASRFLDKLKVWVARPGWRPADVAARWPGAAFDIRREVFHPPLSTASLAYCLMQFSLLLLVTTHFLAAHATLSMPLTLLYAGWLIGGLWIVGGLMQQESSHYRLLESLRLVATAAAILSTQAWFGGVPLTPSYQVVIVAWCVASLAMTWKLFNLHRKVHGHLPDH